MNGRYSRPSTSWLAITILIIVVSLAGCRACTTTTVVKNGNENIGPTPGPTATTSPAPSPIVVDPIKGQAKDEEKVKDIEPRPPVGGGSLVANVQRNSENVFINGKSLENDIPRDLYAGWRVATDNEGQAMLNLGGCGTVYLFHKSRFVMATCPKSQFGKLGTCGSEGVFAYNNSCTRKFRRTETPGSEIELLGTFFGVIHRPEENLSLVLVSKGAVRVRPVIQIKNRVMEARTVEGVETGTGFFYYTTPGKDPADLGGVPQRQAQPFDELPKLLKAVDDKGTGENIRDQVEAIRNEAKRVLGPGTPPNPPEPPNPPTPGPPLPPTGRNVIPPPNEFNFASPAVGVPQSKEIVLAVKDNVPVTFKPFYINGLNHSEFQLTADECSGKTIATKCTLMATFTPVATTKHQAVLNIPSNADNSPNSISLIGIVGIGGTVGPDVTTGPSTTVTTGPSTTVTTGPSTTPPNFSVTESRTFEIRKISTQSPPKVITVTNEGVAPIVIAGVEVKGIGGNFKLGTDNCLNQKVEPQGKCTVEILYTPQTEGTHMANLLVTAKSTSPVTIAVSPPVASKSSELSGRGGMPLANFAPDALCFDRWKKVKSGESTIRERLSLYVSNSGTAPLTVSGVDIEGANKQDFSVTENTCRVVDINGNCQITVGFTPTAEKVRKGSLVITHDGSRVPNQVPLTGVGKPRNWFFRLIDRLRAEKKPC
jgi:hypothetical protein